MWRIIDDRRREDLMTILIVQLKSQIEDSNRRAFPILCSSWGREDIELIRKRYLFSWPAQIWISPELIQPEASGINQSFGFQGLTLIRLEIGAHEYF